MPMTPILVFSTAHKHSRTLFPKAQNKKKKQQQQQQQQLLPTSEENKEARQQGSDAAGERERQRCKHASTRGAVVGAGAASASAAGDSWGDPAVTLLESREDSLADPIVKAAAFARRFIGRPGRSLLCCSFDPRIHWANRSGRYSAAVSTRRFIG